MQLYTTFKTFLQKKTTILLMVMALFSFGPVFTSCGGPKSGCPINEKAKTRVNKKGQLSGKKGKSNLFPKKVRKKIKTK